MRVHTFLVGRGETPRLTGKKKKIDTRFPVIRLWRSTREHTAKEKREWKPTSTQRTGSPAGTFPSYARTQTKNAKPNVGWGCTMEWRRSQRRCSPERAQRWYLAREKRSGLQSKIISKIACLSVSVIIFYLSTTGRTPREIERCAITEDSCRIRLTPLKLSASLNAANPPTVNTRTRVPNWPCGRLSRSAIWQSRPFANWQKTRLIACLSKRRD